MSSVFLCHASEDKPFVEPIQLALASVGSEVFYDEQSLPPGGDYQARIRAAINNCDVFVFIASPASIAPGRFTLTELKFARERWPSPVKRVLPVATGGLKPRDLPSYLQATTVLTLSGNAAAEVRAAVEVMLREVRSKRLRRWSITLALGSAALVATLAVYRHSEPMTSLPQPQNASPMASDLRMVPPATNLNGAQRAPLPPPPGLKYRNATQEAQVLLKALGYEVIADGFEGPMTTAYLEEFQRKHNLAVTGAADDQTLEALRRRAEKAFLRKDRQ